MPVLAVWLAWGVATLSASVEPEGEKPAQTCVILVQGAGGEETYEKQFNEWAQSWRGHCTRAGARLVEIGRDEDKGDDIERLRAALQGQQADGNADLWVVLIGHGTFDGKAAKFNLRGPDVTAPQLAEWLAPFQRPLAVINTASCSGPFLAALSKPGRVIITATKSGSELNFTRFGGFFSKAIGSLDADLDKDGQVSLLEAWLSAASGVEEFYKSEGRLATEHSLMDDNGDGLGTPADWFRGVRAVKEAAQGAGVDGRRAHQMHLIRSEREKNMPAELRAERDKLELEVFQLRDTKAKLPEAEYYKKLEALMLQLGRIYERAGSRN